MKLRKQLLILSLVTLSLPWVGCQYIRDMDKTLRSGQSMALLATAKAVSARISNDETLEKLLSDPSRSQETYYAHPLKSPVFIDGYDDDWIIQDLDYQPLISSNSSQKDRAIFGIWENTLNTILKIDNKPARYFNPSNNDLRHSDHVILKLRNNRYALFASAPGMLNAVVLGSNNSLSDVNEHQIKGVWQETDKGYQIEFSFPRVWAEEGIGIQFNRTQSSVENSPSLTTLVSHSEKIADELRVFSDSDLKIQVITHHGYIVANEGAIRTQINYDQHGFVQWLYSFALGERKFTELDLHYPLGALSQPDIQEVMQGQASKSWHSLGEHVVARVAQPIFDSNNELVIGAVLVEQSVNSLQSLTNSAFNRLLAYSFFVSSLAALCLVFYATWLSIRIRRLSAAASLAISESGKITESFPVSTSADEIGELSRSYGQLLVRLREYTHYLRTLSSKLSHELRTPLAIVRSSLDNLEHVDLSDQARVYAERAREGTTRLSNILNSMSAASRVEQAIGAAECETIPCDELLVNLKGAYSDVYSHVHFQLNIRGKSKDLEVLGAGELLVQALDKLVDNAADFCPQEGLIELGLYNNNDKVIFTVRNEGPPLPRHMQNQLFDSMVSVRDQQPAEDSHHLGLGLYIVRLITDFHQGEVKAYNVPDNSGVIFELRLPAANKSH